MKPYLAITLFENVQSKINSGDLLGAVTTLLSNAAVILMGFVGALSVIFLIVGGIQYITSAGNSDGSAKAKKTITYAVAGLVLALSTTAIINLIGNTFQI